MYAIHFARDALDDIPKLKAAKLDKKVQALLEVLSQNPFQSPPPYEKLVGNLRGAYSRRINMKHRLVYEVDTQKRTVKILSMWTHY